MNPYNIARNAITFTAFLLRFLLVLPSVLIAVPLYYLGTWLMGTEYLTGSVQWVNFILTLIIAVTIWIIAVSAVPWLSRWEQLVFRFEQEIPMVYHSGYQVWAELLKKPESDPHVEVWLEPTQPGVKTLHVQRREAA